jgi:rubrerythrin
MDILKAADVLEFAVTIEENGEEFYEYAAELCGSDKTTAEMFLFLAKEEHNHQETYAKMLENVRINPASESLPGEYLDYVNAVVKNIIFPDERKMALKKQVCDIPSALEFAMAREKDSIIYYIELKRFVNREFHSIIDTIIEEERKHFSMLSKLKQEI